MGERARGRTIFTFEDDGRLIIQDPDLVKRIGDHLRKSGTVELSLSTAGDSGTAVPIVRWPPPPPDTLCGCSLRIVPSERVKNI